MFNKHNMTPFSKYNISQLNKHNTPHNSVTNNTWHG